MYIIEPIFEAMKNRLIATALLGLVLGMSSCVENNTPGPVGPRGPQGPQGPVGEPGENGFILEYENVNFTAPNYEVFLNYGDFEVLPSDVVLVYLLWDVQEIEGEFIEIWRPLPQQVFHPDGLLQYNFDFAVTDTRLFLDANFPLDLLSAIDTDQWIVRLVIAPGDFVDFSGRVDLSDYEAVKTELGLPDREVPKNTHRRR
jgi:hypothetical protein